MVMLNQERLTEIINELDRIGKAHQKCNNCKFCDIKRIIFRNNDVDAIVKLLVYYINTDRMIPEDGLRNSLYTGFCLGLLYQMKYPNREATLPNART